MKKLALLTFGVVALASGTATAADMPVKAPIVPPAPCCVDWAGFYLGVHGGYGWKRNDFHEVISTTPLLTLGGIDSRGWVLGGQAGYNWQYGWWVVGLEIDFSATRIRGDSDPLVRTFAGPLTITDIVGDDVKWLGTARARLGFNPTPGVLLYGTGGLAWERVNRIDTEIVVTPAVTQTVVTTAPRDWFGWVAGVGGEFKLFNNNWIGRIEYLHYDFGTVESTTVVNTTVGTSFADTAGRQTIDVVRVGLSYRFCDCDRVGARY